MTGYIYKFIIPILITSLCVTLLPGFASNASSAVTVFDEVTAANKVMRLKALTKGRFFPDGGRLVTFYVDDLKIGTTLSGGDGFAFIRYTPSSSGVLSVKAEAEGVTDEGVLLALAKNDKLIVVEVEGPLVESLFSLKPVKESNEILNQLSKTFRLLYITPFMGVNKSRSWLAEHKFPRSAVLKWEGAEALSELQEKGIQLYAVIASPGLLSDVPGIDNKFSFTETEEATVVRDWNDLFEKLKAD